MSPGRAGKHTVYHIGRVQTPTLAVVVEREESIRDFVMEPPRIFRNDDPVSQKKHRNM